MTQEDLRMATREEIIEHLSEWHVRVKRKGISTKDLRQAALTDMDAEAHKYLNDDEPCYEARCYICKS